MICVLYVGIFDHLYPCLTNPVYTSVWAHLWTKPGLKVISEQICDHHHAMKPAEQC